MTTNLITAVVVGGIGTDLVALRLPRLVGPGELAQGGELKIGAGGKSRNIAQMLSILAGPGVVAMVGKTSRDPLGLWQVPINALNAAGVNTDNIRAHDFEECGKFPQIALIAVDTKGNNQIYVVPGINEDFSRDDIQRARGVFQTAKENGGFAVLSLEMPFETALATMELCNEIGLRIMLDPGGIADDLDAARLFDYEIYLLKPNEHEAKILTGIEVTDLHSAKSAALALRQKRVANVLITMGSSGAFLFTENEWEMQIPIPEIAGDGQHDETGCGDQTMAALCARLLDGDAIAEAAQHAILAGTLQFNKLGIIPITRIELEQHLAKPV